MHSSSNAFDRVKSLLGKLDRSIDDARRRRLTDGEEPETAAPAAAPAPLPQTKPDLHEPPARQAPAPPEQTRPEAPPRASSKYGRARPIRDLSGPGQPSWQGA
jgi:hypothetical protein